jgi:hypothetical protein
MKNEINQLVEDKQFFKEQFFQTKRVLQATFLELKKYKGGD